MQLQTQPLLAVNQAGAVVATHDLAAGAFIGQYTGQVSLLNSGECCWSLTLVFLGDDKGHIRADAHHRVRGQPQPQDARHAPHRGPGGERHHEGVTLQVSCSYIIANLYSPELW